eukprot:gnl/MRDRNA2_/MRDRNA2_88270_c0_seq1.p1 gnl/MRDRNA2_/MRDRNA2_88270_c0~~gnl/MRDRNA2_/MRDRNA2_88270_c0_seq1.p1  ORF type:complete len:266 (+),score=73.73 gnl/MRDRNA2_/MRDRNA2_88270_c0_seq1:122-919(+)
MVLVEEIVEEETKAEEVSDQARASSDTKKSSIKKGFLNDAAEKGQELYGPEGSKEGHVSAETHKAHAEHKMNEDMNKGMNRGADPEKWPQPEWYTPEYPKGCQYNSPGCYLNEMEKSGHPSDLHKSMVQNNDRFKAIQNHEAEEVRLAFLQITDEDLEEVCVELKKMEKLKSLDLSYNKIKDVGVQTLIGALCKGAAPNLEELRVYKNDITHLGECMLTQGLQVFRKKLKIVVQEPDYSVYGKKAETPVENVPAPAASSEASEMD